MKALLLISIVAFAARLAVAGEPTLESVEGVLKAEADRQIKLSEQQLAQVKQGFRQLPVGPTRGRVRKELQDRRDALEKRIKDLKSGDELAIPDLAFGTLELGRFGRVAMDENSQWLRVISASDGEFIATLGYQEKILRQGAASRGIVSFDRENREGTIPILFRDKAAAGQAVPNGMIRLEGVYLVSERIERKGLAMLAVEPFSVREFLVRKRAEKDERQP